MTSSLFWSVQGAGRLLSLRWRGAGLVVDLLHDVGHLGPLGGGGVRV